MVKIGEHDPDTTPKHIIEVFLRKDDAIQGEKVVQRSLSRVTSPETIIIE